ncbi:MAG: Holliday junction resolvase RuvX [Patescibacteria group bacterium]
MRYIGIDYGSKRIGIAVADDEGKIAFPRECIDNASEHDVCGAIKKIIDNEGIQRVIIGLPLSFAGVDTDQTAEVRAFAEMLSHAVQLSIEFQNEVLSSRTVERAGIEKNRVDSAAAALILQSYIDAHQNN